MCLHALCGKGLQKFCMLFISLPHLHILMWLYLLVKLGYNTHQITLNNAITDEKQLNIHLSPQGRRHVGTFVFSLSKEFYQFCAATFN